MVGNGSFLFLFPFRTNHQINHILNSFGSPGPLTYTDRSEAFKDITVEDDAKAVTPKDVEEDAAALLMLEIEVSPFKGLIPKTLELVAAPSLYFFLTMVQYLMSTMVSNLMVATEITDMIKLVNEAFHCLGTFNLGLQGCTIKFFTFMPLGKMFGCGGRPREIATKQRCLFKTSGSHLRAW